MGLLGFLFRTSRWIVVAALAASLVSGFGSAWLVALINDGLSAKPDQLAVLGLEFAAVAWGVYAARYLAQTLFVRLSQRSLARMRRHVSGLLLDAPFEDIERQGAARIMAVLTEDIRTIADFFVQLPDLTMQGAVVCGCLVYLSVLSPAVFLVALVAMGLGSGLYYLAQQRAIGHLRAARSEQDLLYQHFRALHDAAAELRLHRGRRADFQHEALGASIDRTKAHSTRGLATYAAAEASGSFLFFAFIGSVLFGAAQWLPIPQHVLSGYALVFLHMVLPLDVLLSALPSITPTKVALERVEESTSALSRQREPARVGEASPVTGPEFRSVELRAVVRTYPAEGGDGRFVLGPLDLSFRPGELIFVVGGNGSGKTTLAKLLVGLYRPDAGEILYNGQPVTAAQGDSYRQTFSTVFSNFYLFDDLLGLNVRDGDRLAQAQGWIAELKLASKVSIADGRFSTTALSTGQRKRLALLVAYLEDRPFYVFDEWAADQDPEFRELFYTRLLPELRERGKCVLAITHDDRYFHLADRCITLELGQLVRQSGIAVPVCRARGTVAPVAE